MTTQAVSTQQVTAEVFIDAPTSQLYYHFSTLSGWIDWFAQKSMGYVSERSILQLHHDKAGRMAFFFREIVPERRIVFSFLTPEKLVAGDVEISFETDGQGTAIRVEHTGLEPEEAEQMQNLWQESLNNLKELVELARDPRLWNRPFLGVTVADWVTPEYAQKHDLAAESGMHINSVFEGRGAAEAGITAGDTMISLAGRSIDDYESLLKVYSQYQAGDTVDVEYYHGQELRQARLTLSSFPVPEVQATAHDIADKLDHFFQKVNQKLEQMLAGQNEAQMEYRPAAGEWNIKEVLAHMIASETDSIHWLGSYLAGREVNAYTSATPARLKALLQQYPNTNDLLQKLHQSQTEMVALINEIPAEVVNRKASMVRLSFAYSLEISMHYKEHLSQISDNLEQAADVQSR